ncbi:MAG: cysteine methyltransferase [Dictyoglomus sp. NZ13-RE01]|nr:MAG: cysteine methyltransferase [Dictyoglomus sp. NZ13-RE01]
MTGILPIYNGYLVVFYEDRVVKKIFWQEDYIDGYEKFPYFNLFKSYFEGERVDFSNIPLDYSQVPYFYKKVYEVAREIPYGNVISYKGLAEKLGDIKKARAVGQAMAKNPFLIVVPCHRVIKSNGELGDFSLGIDFKRKLLNLEGVRVEDLKWRRS